MMPGFKAKHSNETSIIVEADGDGDQAMQGTTEQEPPVSLARILFAACDRCVCCGGKFTG